MKTTRIIEDLDQAAIALRNGMLVAFPTETVYGLGADATNPAALKRLFDAKGRPSDNPLIVHLASLDQLPQATSEVTEHALQLLHEFSPGPITVVVKKHPNISDLATAGLGTVGVRIPRHHQASEILRLCGLPIAAPSANLSGRPSCTTWQAVREDMSGRIDFIVKGNVSAIGIESTVVDCTGKHPILLRKGAITLEDIQRLIPTATRWNEHESPVGLPSPGLRHAHYRPKATVRLISSPRELNGISADILMVSCYAGIKPTFSAGVELSKGESQTASAATKGDPVNENANENANREAGSISSAPEAASSESETANATSKATSNATSHLLLCVEFPSIEEYAKGFYEFLREADRRGARQVFLQVAPDDLLGAALRDRQLRAAAIEH